MTLKTVEKLAADQICEATHSYEYSEGFGAILFNFPILFKVTILRFKAIHLFVFYAPAK